LDFFDLKKEVTVLKKGVKDAFKKVQDESDEHLDSINANTSEIQSLQELCSELDMKIEKLDEKIDSIRMILENVGLVNKCEFDFAKKIELTKSEHEIYDTLLNSDEELTYLMLSHNTGFDQESIKSILLRLAEKGVPIIQKFLNNIAYISLHDEFRKVTPTIVCK